MTTDYKEQDRKKILDYLASRGCEVSVDTLIAESGADKMRVYPILFEEAQAGHIQVIELSKLGAPEKVALKWYGFYFGVFSSFRLSCTLLDS